MGKILFAFLFSVIAAATPANAATYAVPGSVGAMIEDDSNLARIKSAEIGIEQLDEDVYLLSIRKFPIQPNRTMEPIGASSRVADCLADYLAFQHKKSSWSVGYSMQARDEFYENPTGQLDYYVLLGRKPETSLKDKSGRGIDTWNHPHGEYGFHRYRIRKGCETNKIKPEWLSSWETYRAPVSYSNIGEVQLPNRIWAFFKQTNVDEMSKTEELLPIANAAVSLREIDPKLYALRVTFDEPVRSRVAMWNLLHFPLCITDHLSRRKGFEIFDWAVTESEVGRPNEKSTRSDEVLSIEYLLLLDVRENEQRPAVAGFKKSFWLGENSSIATMRSLRASWSEICRRAMADEFVATR